jgi:hypothetical protein
MRGSPLVEFAVHFRNVLFGVLLQIVTEKSEKTNEVIALYKKKKSVMEISKLLNMGQGEVKLIIELYCK